MFFRQLLDRESCTWTYLLADVDSGDAAIVDPVLECVERDALLISELGLKLRFAVETHIHADHVTGGGRLRERFGCQQVGLSLAGAAWDLRAADGEQLSFGRHRLTARHTPGHTLGCCSWMLDDNAAVFSGDTLLVRGCGRTDFQEGDAATLYRSVHTRIFCLPDATPVYPGHDYLGRTATTVGEERRFNPRLGNGRTEAEFVDLMAGLKLDLPKKIDVAVPANLAAGRC